MLRGRHSTGKKKGVLPIRGSFAIPIMSHRKGENIPTLSCVRGELSVCYSIKRGGWKERVKSEPWEDKYLGKTRIQSPPLLPRSRDLPLAVAEKLIIQG